MRTVTARALYRLAKAEAPDPFTRRLAMWAQRLFYRGMSAKNPVTWPNWHYALNVLDETPPGSVCIFDHTASAFARAFAERAHRKGIRCLSVPHGLIVFYELPGGQPIEDAAPPQGEHLFSFYDRVVMPNEFSAAKYERLGLSRKKMAVLGSARFCPEWMRVVKELYPLPPGLPPKEEKTNVLFLLEKSENRDAQVSNVSAQMKSIELLEREKEINLAVKLNTRSISRTQKAYLDKTACLKIDETYTTQELIAWADITVGGATSVVFDPLMRGKTVIIMDYVQPVTLVYPEYKAPIVVSAPDELLAAIKGIQAGAPQQYDQQGRQRLLDDFVFAGKHSEGVLATYAAFLKSLVVHMVS